jgi:3-hydroxyisobutyrate dehydrogenase
MGAGMARNIAAAGIPLTVWNRTREKADPLADAGARVAQDAAEAVREAQVVLTMLADADAVESTIRDAAPGLRDDAVWVQQATVGVEGCARLAQVAAELGVTYVDAPVLGTRGPAESGQLTVLASGPAAVQSLLEPLFDAIGARTLWLGEAGQGSRLKLVANSWVLTVVEGVAESLTLARALGLRPEQFLEVIAGGGLDAPYVQLKGKLMIANEFPTSFAVSGVVKDLDLIAAAMRGADVHTDVVDAVAQAFRAADATGHGDEDMAAVVHAFRPKR